MRVLLIERDGSVAQLLTEYLSDEGHVVVRVVEASQARRHLADTSWDVVITDGGRGVSLIHDSSDLAELAVLARHAPVVLAGAQAWAQPDSAAALGVAAVVARPFGLDTLSAALRRVVPA